MRTEDFMKNRLLPVITTLALSNAGLVFAHDQDNTLSPSPSATDYYQVNCYDDNSGAGPAAYLELELLTTSKATPIVSLQVKTTDNSGPFLITNITDSISGDKIPSRTVRIANKSATPYTKVDEINNANGYYVITVNKTLKGKQSYHFSFHCIGLGGHTGTDIEQLQKDFPK
jgi:hypothetical protein